jgi:hypothetical protein
MPREELSTDIPLPTPRPKRQTASEKARALLNESQESEALEAGEGKGETIQPEVEPVITYKALTGRVFADQHTWFCQIPKKWRSRYPRKPKLTRDELMRIAIEYLRDNEDELDALIERYRS